MSAPSSTSSSEGRPAAGGRRLLALLAAGLAFWLALYLAVVLLIDPYGVSPLQLRLEGINLHKPKRVDIDRTFKPVEVWLRQPRTIFLGTSRTQQGVDPAVLDGTPHAPAYNAAVPNGSVPLNLGYLRLYADADRRLQTAFVELFLYNFLIPALPEDPAPRQDFAVPPLGVDSLIENAASLLLSGDALVDSVRTLNFNRHGETPGREVMPGGWLRYPPGHDAATAFSGFPDYVWQALHPQPPHLQAVNLTALEALREMRQMAAEAGIDLIVYLAPNHIIHDFYLELAGGWPAIERLLLELSAIGGVYSLAQPGPLSAEPIRREMTYWYDPFHYTPAAGEKFVRALAGQAVADMPEDFLVPLTAERVPALIAARRQAVRDWAAANPDWARQMDEAYRRWRDARS